VDQDQKVRVVSDLKGKIKIAINRIADRDHKDRVVVIQTKIETNRTEALVLLGSLDEDFTYL
jgi:hypothetical protein